DAKSIAAPKVGKRNLGRNPATGSFRGRGLLPFGPALPASPAPPLLAQAALVGGDVLQGHVVDPVPLLDVLLDVPGLGVLAQFAERLAHGVHLACRLAA